MFKWFKKKEVLCSSISLTVSKEQANSLFEIMNGAVFAENEKTGKVECFGCGVSTSSVIIFHKDHCVVDYVMKKLRESLPEYGQYDPCGLQIKKLSKILSGFSIEDVEQAIKLLEEHRSDG